MMNNIYIKKKKKKKRRENRDKDLTCFSNVLMFTKSTVVFCYINYLELHHSIYIYI